MRTDHGKPNKPGEKTAGLFGSVAAGLWGFSAALHIVDWISRGQTILALDPYVHYLVTPWGLLLELLAAVGFLNYATKLETIREADEAPRIIMAYTQPPTPRRHRLWLKLGGALAVAALLSTVFISWLHYRHRRKLNPTQSSASRLKSTPPNLAPSPHGNQSQQPETRRPVLRSQQANSHPTIVVHDQARGPAKPNPEKVTAIPSPGQQQAAAAVPPPQVPITAQSAVSLYQQVENTRAKVSELDSQWRSFALSINQQFYSPYKNGLKRGSVPTVFPDNLVDTLIDKEGELTERYKGIEPEISRTHSDVINYMKLTPNEVARDKEQFLEADQKASLRTPISELQKSGFGGNKFQPMISYLSNLLNKLGDLH